MGLTALPPPSLRHVALRRGSAYRLLGGLFLYPDQGRLDLLHAGAGELRQEEDSLAVFAFFGPFWRLLEMLSGPAEDGQEQVEGEYPRLGAVNVASLRQLPDLGRRDQGGLKRSQTRRGS